jgi:hypothetical protein
VFALFIDSNDKYMKAIDLLATSLNRRDEQPNQDLAIKIIQSKRHDWIKELVDHLHNEDKDIQSDSIKVLYEIGERGSADMIAPYCKSFGEVLKSKNNRLIWGAMTALDMIASVSPKEVFDLLPSIMSAIDKGSVITVDHGVAILARLSGIPECSATTFPLLIEQLKKCPPKQLPMYAEKSVIAVNSENKERLIGLLQSRMNELEKDTQKRRVNKVISRMVRG